MSLLLSGFTRLQVEVYALPFSDINGDTFNPGITLPSGADNAGQESIETILSWGQGIVVVIGILGVLFCAGKMAVGKFGRSDLAAEGVGGLVWTVLGISLMLIAVPVIMLLLGSGGGEAV
ncbi:hypothetical protein [Marinitenerispora sediminis]|uniref:hypothetical protein n=1 Tax=Marinitenerispora sediminis TaxID=1931232 RepID=UPI001F25517E|nr:hypothetical protein [Marinitenerispora sediminis]